MGGLTDFDTKRMHTQLRGRANFSELANYEEKRRILRIRWTCYGFAIVIFFIWFLLILFSGWPSSDQHLKIFIASIVLAILLLVIGFFTGRRKRINIAKLKKSSQGENWEKIERLPDWAYRRMNKKHKNKVRGEHYIYMRSEGKYFRKRYK